MALDDMGESGGESFRLDADVVPPETQHLFVIYEGSSRVDVAIRGKADSVGSEADLEMLTALSWTDPCLRSECSGAIAVVDAVIMKYPGKTVAVHGHSLGGTMATVVAMNLPAVRGCCIFNPASGKFTASDWLCLAAAALAGAAAVGLGARFAGPIAARMAAAPPTLARAAAIFEAMEWAKGAQSMAQKMCAAAAGSTGRDDNEQDVRAVGESGGCDPSTLIAGRVAAYHIYGDLCSADFPFDKHMMTYLPSKRIFTRKGDRHRLCNFTV